MAVAAGVVPPVKLTVPVILTKRLQPVRSMPICASLPATGMSIVTAPSASSSPPISACLSLTAAKVPLLVSLSGDATAIHAVMALTETLACKPDMLLSALSTFCGLENAPDALIIRNGLLGRDENGELTPLENL